MAEINVRKLHGELTGAGLDIHGVNSDPKIHWASAPSGAQLATAQAIIAAHDPIDHEKIAKAANQADAQARFLLSQLAAKTPQQIYTAMQGAMDGWGSLADAKADLREWLPLMAAILAWKVV